MECCSASLPRLKGSGYAMNSTEDFSRYIAQHVAAIPKSGIRDFFEVVQSMADVISLGVGEPDFVTPWRIREAAIYSLEKGFTTYTSNWGLLELRQAAAAYLDRHYGVEYSPQHEVLITVGGRQGLDLALRAMLK